MKFSTYIPLLFLPLTIPAQKKQVCFTIDDLPVVSYGITDSVYQKKLFTKLVTGLKKSKIPAIGFVNEVKLYHQNKLLPYQVQLLEYWVDQGLELGNHTFTHQDYNTSSLANFTQEIKKGEIVTKDILARKGTKERYFRHPYLHMGATQEKADSLNQLLQQLNYTIAPVTLDNEDYLFALAYKRTQDKKDTELMQQIGKDYVAYMEKKLLYFEQQSTRLFGHNIRQILLFHASALNADYLDALAQMFRKNGYQFITLNQALADRAYQTPISVFGKWGITWIDRWAMSQGKKGDFFKGEPETPTYIQKLAE
jgi:peptidoglycan/xylan/chitin deacetylase (PgdA/CDA1 family)